MSCPEETIEVGDWAVFQSEAVSQSSLKYIRSDEHHFEKTEESLREVARNYVDVWDS